MTEERLALEKEAELTWKKKSNNVIINGFPSPLESFVPFLERITKRFLSLYRNHLLFTSLIVPFKYLLCQARPVAVIIKVVKHELHPYPMSKLDSNGVEHVWQAFVTMGSHSQLQQGL